VIDIIRFGLVRDLRKIRQDFSRAIPRLTGAVAWASARLTVRWVGVSSPSGGRLRLVGHYWPGPLVGAVGQQGTPCHSQTRMIRRVCAAVRS
jgi:hypothetical protein